MINYRNFMLLKIFIHALDGQNSTSYSSTLSRIFKNGSDTERALNYVPLYLIRFTRRGIPKDVLWVWRTQQLQCKIFCKFLCRGLNMHQTVRFKFNFGLRFLLYYFLMLDTLCITHAYAGYVSLLLGNFQEIKSLFRSKKNTLLPVRNCKFKAGYYSKTIKFPNIIHWPLSKISTVNVKIHLP